MLAQQLAEVAAGDVFQRADRTGQLITMELVRARLAELKTHPEGCRCGLCGAARVVDRADAYRIASTWPRQCDRRFLARIRAIAPGQRPRFWPESALLPRVWRRAPA